MAKNDGWEDVPLEEEDKGWEDVPLYHEPTYLDKGKQFLEEAAQEGPMLGAMAGGILGGVSPIPGAAMAGASAGAYLGSAGKRLYNDYVHPETAPKDPSEYFTEPLTQAAYGALGEVLPDIALKGVNAIAKSPPGRAVAKKLNPVAEYIKNKFSGAADAVKKSAGKFAENATGATAKQTERFQEGAGEKLLDKGNIVNFGSNALGIAKNAKRELNKHGQAIGAALKEMDKKGVNIESNTLRDAVKARIKELSKDESQAPLARGLKSELDVLNQNLSRMEEIRIEAQALAKKWQKSGDESLVLRLNELVNEFKELKALEKRPISEIEKVKRGYQSASGEHWDNPEVHKKTKAMSDIYRGEVEKEALKANPELGEKFIKDKQDMHLLYPIEEAAARRAKQLNQHPFGGLVDTAAFIAGSAGDLSHDHKTEGLLKGAGAVALKRAILPRVTSSTAVTLNLISRALREAPQALGKFGPALEKAAQKGSKSLGMVGSILATDPEFQEMLKNLER
jgi:hypothetical protein